MRKTALISFITSLMVTAVSCTPSSSVQDAGDQDSVYRLEYIQELGATDYDAAMQLAEEGMRKGHLSAFQAYQLKSNLTYQHTEDNASAALWLRKALEQEEAQDPVTRAGLLYHLATILEADKDYTACLATCTEGKGLAHDLGQVYQQHSFDFIVGRCLFGMGEGEEGLKLMKEAVGAASKAAKSEEEYGHLAFFASSLINSYMAVDDYSAAIEECTAYEKLIEAMAAACPEMPGSYLDRCHFYLDIDRAICFAVEGDKTKALQAFDRALGCRFSQTAGGKTRLVDYYAATGEPERVHAIFEEIPFTEDDTVSRTYRLRIARLKEAYRNAGMVRKEEEYEARYDALSELIEQKELSEGTRTKAAEYGREQYRMALDDTTSVLKKHHLWFTVLMLLTAVAFTLFLLLNQYFSKRKEAEFCKETDALKKDMKALQKQVSLITERKLHTGEIPEKNPSLAELIEGNSLYLNKNLTRDSAAALLGIPQSEITRMLEEIEPGLSFPDYIKGLRMRHALKLLGENPDIPIAELADRSGFYTVRTLQRSFQSITGKTPSEYARELKNSIDEHHE